MEYWLQVDIDQENMKLTYSVPPIYNQDILRYDIIDLISKDFRLNKLLSRLLGRSLHSSSLRSAPMKGKM